MKSLLLRIAFIVAVTLLIIIACGKDHKSTNPAATTPVELVGTWRFNSTMLNGVPIDSFQEVSHVDTAETGTVTFNSNASWDLHEYHSDVAVYAESGALMQHGDTLFIVTTAKNGHAVTPDDTTSAFWEVTSDTLSLISWLEGAPIPMVIHTVYLKE
jgi:hypothetical protein